ncbi:TrkH family potassium uptake protein [Alteromonas hispanica]|uniref:Ktr system potassium transporter B n=1 Tax=Alteromonas hispanica TaxID=315421 RepID=A0A6L9MV89_9ALTE|nr:TrkH family potassium uptake protein [Alteromonas hispanica]NDW22159.1 Ktr system potassium transporter B [Alteromonas hispanica]
MVQWHPSVRRIERSPKAAKKIQAAPPLVLSMGFLLLIVVGMLLLKLPISTHMPLSWLDSFFTATSAVTVTGLVVADTGTEFTFFGQFVIMLLIQFGGLGLMTFAVVTLMALGGKIGFFQQTVAKEAFNQTDTSTLVSTAKSVILFALMVESIGVLILTLRWASELGWATSLWHAVFYTVSAFNNAGFALSSDSLVPYVSDPTVNIAITALFITGGLGFSVWLEMWQKRQWKTLSPYSRLMLTGTVIINVVALLLVYLIEFDNPNTLAPLSTADKWLAAWFQAVTPRTAGFNTLDIASLEEGTTAVMLLLMFIGGGSLSTASGVKVVTFFVLLFATYSFLRRDSNVETFGRTIPTETVRKALALTIIYIGVTWIGIFLLLLSEDSAFIDVVFETVSALGTVGLSRGLTGELSGIGKGIIIVLMFIGRLGPLTLAYFLASPRVKVTRYPSSRFAIG